MADEATLSTEEKLTTFIEKIITRALDEQQKNLCNIISGNFEISKQQIAELKQKINELKQSIEHTENVLEDKVARVEENLEHIESRLQEMYDYQLDPAFIKHKLIDFEDRSRRDNLRVDGIKEKPNETREGYEKQLDTLFNESLGIEEEVVIERAHRGKVDKSRKSNAPRTIVCRILDYKDKVKILRNSKKLKSKSIFINEDLYQATLDHYQELWKEVKRLREEDKIAYLQYRFIVVERRDNTR